MNTYLYKKSKRRNIRKIARFTGLGLAMIGLLLAIYVFYPLLSWQLYLRPVFASSNFASPIPQKTIMTPDTIASLLENSLNRGDWLPSIYQDSQITSAVTAYQLSIPKLKIENAEVSTLDTDISRHLVHFPGTAMPPKEGNAVIFGHSTLPQLYDPKNYKTIFANIHNMTAGDKILITSNNTIYTYVVTTISIVDAHDTSYLTQDQEKSFLTIVTCTPPGTTWKRLILKAKLEKS
jgi:sortase A